MVSYQAAPHLCSPLSNILAKLLEKHYKKKSDLREKDNMLTKPLGLRATCCFLLLLRLAFLFFPPFCIVEPPGSFRCQRGAVLHSIPTPVLTQVPLLGGGCRGAGSAGLATLGTPAPPRTRRSISPPGSS